MKKTKVYVAIPSVGTVSDLMPYAFRQYEREYGDRIEFVYPKHCVQRKFHDFARNAMVDDFLETDCDILWFLDSDVVPPPHVLDLITKYGEHWELAGAPYPVFMTPTGHSGPQVVMCVYMADETGMHAAKVPYSGTGFVDGLATGCIFIKREVFAQLEKPYFEFQFDSTSRQLTIGEDLGFCAKVNRLGYKFFTDFDMVCAHYKTVNLLDVNNYAIEYAQRAVNSYDEEIRPKIEMLKGLLKGKSKSGLILPK